MQPNLHPDYEDCLSGFCADCSSDCFICGGEGELLGEDLDNPDASKYYRCPNCGGSGKKETHERYETANSI